jgi:glycosyltransferase involved in cell wall biosynthesis
VVTALTCDGQRGTRSRAKIDGKHFSLNGERFNFRGVTYGTFRPRAIDGARYPPKERIDRDFAMMRASGFTVVRTYTEPTADVLEAAERHRLQLLAGIFYPDWRYMLGASRRERRRIATTAHSEVMNAARRLAGVDHVLALCVGNEIPADVVRWNGTREIASVLDNLVDVVKREDPDRLVTYANYPSAEYLPLDGLDFLTFNVYLERRSDFRRYLTRLHHLAGDRPLVLGEVGADSSGTPVGEIAQAEAIAAQFETAMERGVAGTCAFSWTDEWWVGDAAVEGWHFGLTRADRSAKPALEVARRWNDRTVADLEARWPSLSVIVCAYNAEATLDECLPNTCALDYPGLEVIVFDDGSTDATAAVARRHPCAKLYSIEHRGLSAARNVGFSRAEGELVAYLDSDAYPTPEWPYYLALGLDSRTIGGVGGPNVPPADDPLGAQAVAMSPGGPAHVLTADDRAEHVPGCNMAFWKDVLQEAGGFDPVYTAAGDDVDMCWKVLDAGWEIGFHPAALVWHHRRAGVGAYLRQQRGYGRAEALVAARHPHRFNRVGTARWRGRIYRHGARSSTRQRIYRGAFGSAAYQSVYATSSHGLDMARQAAVALAAISPLALLLSLRYHAVAIVPAFALIVLATLIIVDTARTRPPRNLDTNRLLFRLNVALLHALQPGARAWGRFRHANAARRDHPSAPLPAPVISHPRGILLFPADRPRSELAKAIVARLRHDGFRVTVPSGWAAYDAAIVGSAMVSGRLLTSSHPLGSVQASVRRRVLVGRWVAMAAITGGLLFADHRLTAAVLALGAVSDAVLGLYRLGPKLRRRLIASSKEPRHAIGDGLRVVPRPSILRVTHPAVVESDLPDEVLA